MYSSWVVHGHNFWEKVKNSRKREVIITEMLMDIYKSVTEGKIKLLVDVDVERANTYHRRKWKRV
jgi:hypothetical protein